MAAVTAHYVKSVNGITGNDFYELIRVDTLEETGDYEPVFVPAKSRNKHVILDANDIRVSGSTGDTIKARMQTLAAGVRPLYVESMGNDDYRIKVPNGITLNFVT